MRIDPTTGRLVAKKLPQEIETVVTVKEHCERCGGTGLIFDQYTYDCPICQGHGMVQISQTKTIERNG